MAIRRSSFRWKCKSKASNEATRSSDQVHYEVVIMNERLVRAAIMVLVPLLVIAALAAGSGPRNPENVGEEASTQRLNQIRALDWMPGKKCEDAEACQCGEGCPASA